MSIIPAFSGILHGGDYNPDQWVEEPGVIDEDFRLMDLAHCNTFSVGIFSWSQIEIEEGVYDFAWLDDVFARAAASGRYLLLATPSAARPAWLASRWPETAAAGPDGIRLPWQGRQSACLNSKVFREKVVEIDQRLAERYAAHPALAGWHISNEYSVECWCPDCIEGFRKFLRQRYVTLENLNRCYWSAFWGHRLTSWDQLDPRDSAIKLVQLDWRRYITTLHEDFFQMELAAIRKFSDAPATTNMMGLYGILDDWKIARHCDFISDDCYPAWYPGMAEEVAANFSALHDMHYAMKKKPFLMMESCPGIPNYKPYVRLRRPGEFQREMLMALGHGADGTMYFQWRKGLGNCEQFHGAVVGHDGTERSMSFQTVANYGSHLGNIAEIVDSIRTPDTALILDWEARLSLQLASGFSGEGGKKTDDTIFTHYRALWSHNFDISLIDSTEDFSCFKLLVCPMLFLLKEGVTSRMRQFVEAGGTLVLTYLSGCVDSSDRCFRGGNPGGPEMQSLCGIWSEDVDGLTPEMSQSLVWRDRTFPVFDFAEVIHIIDAEVLGVYQSEFYAGTPALTHRRVGKGHVYYLAARTGLDFLTAFYGELAREAGVRPVMENMPNSVRVSRRIGVHGHYYFLLNFSDEPRMISLPFPMKDLWNNGKELLASYVLPGVGSTVLKAML